MIFLCVDMTIPKLYLPVCLSIPREKKSPQLRQYQSYSSNNIIIDTSMEGFREDYSMETRYLNF